MEYRVIKVILCEMETVLGEYGKAGWKLINIIGNDMFYHLVMERKKDV